MKKCKCIKKYIIFNLNDICSYEIKKNTYYVYTSDCDLITFQSSEIFNQFFIDVS